MVGPGSSARRVGCRPREGLLERARHGHGADPENEPSPGVQLLLCTDGLHGVTSQGQIEKTLASHDSLEAKCRQLIASARAQGGPDNVTAVLLRTS